MPHHVLNNEPASGHTGRFSVPMASDRSEVRGRGHDADCKETPQESQRQRSLVRRPRPKIWVKLDAASPWTHDLRGLEQYFNASSGDGTLGTSKASARPSNHCARNSGH